MRLLTISGRSADHRGAIMYSIQSSETASSTQPVFARRPVLDAGLRTVGYELLLPEDCVWTHAWQELLPTAQPMYLTVTRDWLLEREQPPFDPAAVVLVLAHEGPLDDLLLAGLRGLGERGFKIVLDASSDLSELEPVLALVHVVRLDVLALGAQRALAELAWLKGRGVAVLAAEVHTEDAFTVFRDAGADLFQGLFYERRRLAVRRSVPVAQVAALSALLEPVSADEEFDRLEDLIRRDAGLSYRLLWYANSAFVGVPRPVGSIREALVRLGARVVRQWALALVLSGLEDRPHALLSSTLVRARTCELLVSPYDRGRADQAFTTGLLSTLDALLGAPLQEILDELPLCDEVVAAIVRREGVAGKALEKVVAYERGNFGDPALAGHIQTVVAMSYLDAVRWADGML
ncbi:MAG: HDOD domain-containing protein [Actinobacteria bacterium]|nr:HDOD domain-containing protein [Actinomycetota bacterium]